MAKAADRYFRVDPWFITEDGFNPAYGEVAEAVFSLGNGRLGLRGYFDEGYSGESLQGAYVNGLYERRETNPGAYKGMLSSTEFMINTVDWAHTRITCNGQVLDLAASRFADFRRALDMRTGELTRSFIWRVDEATDVRLSFGRLLSMERLEIGASRIAWAILRGAARLEIRAGLDFTRLHVMCNDNFWNCRDEAAETDFCGVSGITRNTRRALHAAAFFTMRGEPDAAPKLPRVTFKADKDGELCRIARISETNRAARDELSGLSYDGLLAENRAWWAARWALSDVEIDGDEADQQGIRYSVFQMHQTVNGPGPVVIGAKGLTGEAYNGNAFWDSEVYCLPFYLFTNPAAADGILSFRAETLNEAKERAKALDCDGAFYPIATISGRECCDLWQHANTQLQASTAVAYGLWLHAHVTGDDTFLKTQGTPVLVEICRMLASRGGWDPVSGEYGYYGVMGPDEFQIMVSHNRYTNIMAKKTLLFTIDTLASLDAAKPGVAEAELADWRQKAEKMRVGYDERTLLFEQHDGFFNLPHVDVAAIPTSEFPLYSHWAYDRIYRNDMIKQPDVLMFMFMYPADYTAAQLAANFDYYEPRCIHESSLSPSVHSVLACRLGRVTQAYELFKFAARLDLDNYNRNTREGLHTTSIAGSWLNVVFGFAGLSADGERPALRPALPDCWKRLAFRLVYRGRVIRVAIDKTALAVAVEEGEPLEMDLLGETRTVGREGVRAAL